MKIELVNKDGRVIDEICGPNKWVASVLPERISLASSRHNPISVREVDDDTPDLLGGGERPWWMRS